MKDEKTIRILMSVTSDHTLTANIEDWIEHRYWIRTTNKEIWMEKCSEMFDYLMKGKEQR